MNGHGAHGSAGPGAGSGDAVATFLQRFADASDGPSSLLGELARDGADGAGGAGDVGGDSARSEFQERAGGISSGDMISVPPARPAPLDLVLFARAKGRPFVYCGAVECIAQEYVSSAGSSRLGAVRLTLALREWREAIATAEEDREAFSRTGVGLGAGVYARAGGVYAAGGMAWGKDVAAGDRVDDFLDVVQEGLRSDAIEW